MTRSFSLAVLLGAAVYALPGSALGQQYRSPMQNQVVCGPGEMKQGGVCVPRLRVGDPDSRPGDGVGWVSGWLGYEQSMCQWSNYDQSYVFCPSDGRRNPPPK